MPDYSVARKLAEALGVPVAYLYADGEDEAKLLLFFRRMTKRERGEVLKRMAGVG